MCGLTGRGNPMTSFFSVCRVPLLLFIFCSRVTYTAGGVLETNYNNYLLLFRPYKAYTNTHTLCCLRSTGRIGTHHSLCYLRCIRPDSCIAIHMTLKRHQTRKIPLSLYNYRLFKSNMWLSNRARRKKTTSKCLTGCDRHRNNHLLH